MKKSQLASIQFILLSALCLALVSAHSGCRSQLSVTKDSESMRFKPGDCVVGEPHGCHLVFESNCNLVLYNKNTPLWASATAQEDNDECRAIFQSDGNLVVYSHVTPEVSSSYAIWASDTWTHQIQGTILQISNDHHLQIVQTYNNGSYNVTIDVSNPPDHQAPRPFRTSNSSTIIVKSTDDYDFIFQEQQYIGSLDTTNLIFQDDCNFVLYNEQGPQWASDTVKNLVYSCELAVTREGSLKIYASDDPSVVYWSWNGTDVVQGEIIWTEVKAENSVMEITYVASNGFSVTYTTASGGLQLKQ